MGFAAWLRVRKQLIAIFLMKMGNDPKILAMIYSHNPWTMKQVLRLGCYKTFFYSIDILNRQEHKKQGRNIEKECRTKCRETAWLQWEKEE